MVGWWCCICGGWRGCRIVRRGGLRGRLGYVGEELFGVFIKFGEDFGGE